MSLHHTCYTVRPKRGGVAKAPVALRISHRLIMGNYKYYLNDLTGKVLYTIVTSHPEGDIPSLGRYYCILYIPKK